MAKYKIREVLEAVEALAPRDLAAGWDNPGLLVGDISGGCEGAIVALDLSRSVVAQAAAQNCQLILTHHPFIFNAQKQVLAGTYEGDLILALAGAGIAAVAAHTNWDNAAGGINHVLAEALGLQEVGAVCDPSRGDGEILLLAGLLPQAVSAGELLELVRRRLGLAVVRAAGLQPAKAYRRLAVVGGAGLDFWPEAQAAGCDALISADGKHHIGLQAAHSGFAVIDATHFATEVMGIRRLGERLQERLPGLRVCFADEEDAWAFYGTDGRKL